MKKMIAFGLFALLALAQVEARSGQVFVERDAEIANDFRQRRALVNDERYFRIFDDRLTGERLQAMQFLYAYMPLPDVADYSAEFFLQNVDYALKARREMPWGAQVPEREFLHFVLPVRVNNENMDSSRVVFYEELKDRVRHLTMREAVLEVNHWCHEKVTYTPSDARTSSPLASVRTAYGRCGEESTFAVAALRAVGIPARQVYTPRWAHTDDNHAWVEAWVDGRWHFLGACEPEPVLDLAWFNAPASRGMLMHTKVFGHYEGPEEVVGQNACFTEINVTANYAPVAPVVVRVEDEAGNPVSAVVEFKIYNYAEFFTAARRTCNADGYATLSTGRGSLLVWAEKEGKFGFAECLAGRDDTVTIVLNKDADYAASFDVDITPPAERNTVPEVTPAQRAENQRRFAQEDSIRNAYIATFITPERAAEVARRIGVDEKEVMEIFRKSRGNHATIEKFLTEVSREQLPTALSLLCAVAEKDLRDVEIDVLRDHLQYTPAVQVDKHLHVAYVLNPRVSNEMLTPYKAFFRSVFSPQKMKSFAAQPAKWVEWCRRHIRIDREWNPQSLCMSPEGVWNLRVCDVHSRNIFFVAGARSMGIAARIDEVTGKTQYLTDNATWVDVHFEAEQKDNAPQGTLSAAYTPNRFIDNPKYYSHFSLSRIADGRLVLQNYPEDATWQSLLKDGTAVDAGHYLMVTGTRMADGGVLAHLDFFSVDADSRCQRQYVQRESSERLQVIGSFNSENLFHDLSTGGTRSLLSATGRGYYIIALVAPGNEPTNHFLRDVMPYKAAFEEWGQKMVLLFRDKDEAQRFSNDFPDLPNTIVWGTDIDDTLYNEIVTNMKLVNPNRPIILVADTFNRVVFASQGYSIGLGEQLVKVIKQLSE